jgi:hypothetical protein
MASHGYRGVTRDLRSGQPSGTWKMQISHDGRKKYVRKLTLEAAAKTFDRCVCLPTLHGTAP